MKSGRWAVLMAGLALVAWLAPARAEIVYDNTVNPRPGGFIIDPDEDLEIGDDVTLAPGTPRFIIGLRVGVYFESAGVVRGVQARLYENDGPGGEPGTELFASTPMDVNVGVGLFAFDFVPNVLVPDALTWTISAVAWPTATPKMPYYNPPDPGSSDPLFLWLRDIDGDWGKQMVTEGVRNLYAKLEAVPAPGAAILGLIGLGLVGWLRKGWQG